MLPQWIAILGDVFIFTAGTFCLGMIILPWFIDLLRKYKIGKNIREEAVDGTVSKLFSALHAKKSGTPTMGGIAIWGLVVVVVMFSRLLSLLGIIDQSLLQRAEVYLPLFTLIFVGTLGAVDDYFNVKGIGKQKGLPFILRSSILILFGILGALWFYFKLGYTDITIPFVGEMPMGAWYIPFFVAVVFFTSNAVNVTDGLDGLAGGLLIMAFGVVGSLSIMREHIFLGIFCGVVVGALLAFLWYNVAPAQFYMGDTGSFALGACLAVIILMIDMVFVLPFIGFVFFVEAGSVFIQLFSKKFFKKKVFKIAPIHHHFEAIGWSETAIVIRFWIVGGIFTLLGLFVGTVVLEQQKIQFLYQGEVNHYLGEEYIQQNLG